MEIQTINNQDLSFEKVWLMFQESDKKLQRTEELLEKSWSETKEMLRQSALENDQKFQENEKRWKEIREELGGIGKSNGAIAEDFFFTALENKMQVGRFSFDEISRNFYKKRKNLQAQYDIVLYNHYKLLIVEVKYNFKSKYLREFHEGLKKFRLLYPEYERYKIYGAIAGMTFEKEVIEEAQEYGFMVITQNNQEMQLVNAPDFEPNEIK